MSSPKTDHPQATPWPQLDHLLAQGIDRFFFHLTQIAAFLAVAILGGILIEVGYQALPAIQRFGWEFVRSSQWNPVKDLYGALPFIYGSLTSSLIALLVAIPLGFGTAIFLSEDLLPLRVRFSLTIVVELLAAIPSIVYGIWGLYVFIPLTRPIQMALHTHAQSLPVIGSLFSTPPVGLSLLTAGLVLGIMITPIVSAVSRDVLAAIPTDLRTAGFALGATRWEVISGVALPAAAGGLLGAVVLGLGRAMGETMAAALLIGNSNHIQASLLAPSSTIPSLLANEFSEAKGLQLSALMYLSLILLLLTLLVNAIATLIVRRVQRSLSGR